MNTNIDGNANANNNTNIHNLWDPRIPWSWWGCCFLLLFPQPFVIQTNLITMYYKKPFGLIRNYKLAISWEFHGTSVWGMSYMIIYQNVYKIYRAAARRRRPGPAPRHGSRGCRSGPQSHRCRHTAASPTSAQHHTTPTHRTSTEPQSL